MSHPTAPPDGLAGLARFWRDQATSLRAQAGTSMATPHRVQRARADQLDLCAAQLDDAAAGRPATCGARAWPYTENNICIAGPGHADKLHTDPRGRRFGAAGYDRAEGGSR